eukprot:TRINITY_DN882_c0_g1_i1.p1 TRINITY_DN882_c0_g1~~TRINITY_DN882_c0_g1_i1.p1  ORF type:complete len:546 (+),score=131.70 TRINITY_DN882_c0_g1_i1:1200-2837(+)
MEVVLKQILEEKHLKHTFLRKDVALFVLEVSCGHGKSVDLRVSCHVNNSLDLACFRVIWPSPMPKQHTANAITFITRANWRLRVGQFFIDLDDNEFGMKFSTFLDGVKRREHILKPMLSLALHEAHTWAPRVSQIYADPKADVTAIIKDDTTDPRILLELLRILAMSGQEAKKEIPQEITQCLLMGLCTFSVTGPSFKYQKYVVCRTCDTADTGLGYCLHCANTCHKGHVLSEEKVGNFFCDCKNALCKQKPQLHAGSPKTSPVGAPAAGSAASTSTGKKSLLAKISGVATIPRAQVTLGEKIGAGGFGKVYFGTYCETNVCVKVLKEINDPQLMEVFVTEVEVMAKLRHPNIANIIGVIVEEPIGVVLEYYERKSATQLLRAEPELDMGTRNQLCVGAARGMLYLHKQGVLHGDLKPDNLFVDRHYDAKIGDFGLSKIRQITQSLRHTTAQGCTPAYSSPEQFNLSLSQASDVFSFALTAYHIWTGRIPFVATPSEIKTRICGGERPPVDNLPEDQKTLLANCWKHEPKERWTFAQILPFMKQL